MSYRLVPIPAFSDNYIWCLSNREGQALIVDPGEAAPVLQHLETHQLELTALFLTHHHFDHSGGIAELRERFNVPVFGPANSRCDQVTEPLKDGATTSWDGLQFKVMEVPGHTLDHIAFFSADDALEEPLLFCGDTLFVCGCGRLFEGTAAQMRHSLSRLRDLPGDALVCCAHEYTLANLRFARAVTPDDSGLAAYEQECHALRDNNQPTVPGHLEREKKLNPFLRWDAPAVVMAAQRFGNEQGIAVSAEDPDTVFAAIRRWKDQFKG